MTRVWRSEALIRRRQFLARIGAAPFGARAAWADAGAPNLFLLVAGPDGEQTSRWANACALAMSAGFPGGPKLITDPEGGLDGVTGANRLDALVMPDGKTAAVLPGAALIAWMTGDSRVHFDPTRWVPVMAGTNSGVLVARLGSKAPRLDSLRGFAPLRIAVDRPESNDLAALLALQGMGVAMAPVFGLRGTDAKTRAFVAGEVDAVFLCGEGVPEDIAPLTANAGVPVFSLGQLDAEGSIAQDPLFPGVPDAGAFAAAEVTLSAAYGAAAAAARLDFFMVLPKLTGPDDVAAWRQAASVAIANQGVAAAARASSVTLQPASETAAALLALDISAPDQAGIQAYLTTNFGWHPG
jgi:hypothetical protein